MSGKAFVQLYAVEVIGILVFTALVLVVVLVSAAVAARTEQDVCRRITDALHASNQPQAAAIAQAAGGCPKGEK